MPVATMTARLVKVYCYRGKTIRNLERSAWFEAEDVQTGKIIAWGTKKAVIAKVWKLGFELTDEPLLLRYFRSRVNPELS